MSIKSYQTCKKISTETLSVTHNHTAERVQSAFRNNSLVVPTENISRLNEAATYSSLPLLFSFLFSFFFFTVLSPVLYHVSQICKNQILRPRLNSPSHPPLHTNIAAFQDCLSMAVTVSGWRVAGFSFQLGNRL